jgi:hypothetical protein
MTLLARRSRSARSVLAQNPMRSASVISSMCAGGFDTPLPIISSTLSALRRSSKNAGRPSTRPHRRQRAIDAVAQAEAVPYEALIGEHVSDDDVLHCVIPCLSGNGEPS